MTTPRRNNNARRPKKRDEENSRHVWSIYLYVYGKNAARENLSPLDVSTRLDSALKARAQYVGTV